MHLAVFPIQIGKLPIVRKHAECDYRPLYNEKGEGEKERQPVKTLKGHGYRHWPNCGP